MAVSQNFAFMDCRIVHYFSVVSSYNPLPHGPVHSWASPELWGPLSGCHGDGREGGEGKEERVKTGTLGEAGSGDTGKTRNTSNTRNMLSTSDLQNLSHIYDLFHFITDVVIQTHSLSNTRPRPLHSSTVVRD